MLVLLVRATVLGAEAVETAAIGAWAPWAGRQGMALRGMPLLGRGGGTVTRPRRDKWQRSPPGWYWRLLSANLSVDPECGFQVWILSMDPECGSCWKWV